MTSEEARPGLAPGARSPVGTMFAALYGELAPHPWRDPDADPDAYLLFYDRSLAMGWLDDIGGVLRKTAWGIEERQVGAAGLWGMNDAGQAHPRAASEASLAAWFQVGVEAVPGDRPLPVQPFLRCAGDAVARIGTLQLRAVQVLLPVQGLDPGSRPEYAQIPSVRTARWFGGGDPRSRTPVRVTLDSGQAASILSAASEMRERMSGLDQDVFVCESQSLADHDPLAMAAPFDDGLWNGPPLHRVAFHGTLAEWSLDALGWLGGFLADLGAWHGVTTPLLLTASRA
ncbi:hypothetical protein [Micromonospora sp. NPDC006431]|uniref:hypothetical protein n=1 Tax=Micromonospora sp. NPDC006431 TaxID=3364235 RepID=UPI003679E545